MQIREKPPVVVDPDVDHLMKMDMIEIRDTLLDLATRIAEHRDIRIEMIAIRLHHFIEDDWENVIFEIHVSADEASGFAYWEAVCDAISEVGKNMSKSAQAALNDHVGVFVEW
jgi:hypothetical protein